MSGQASWAECFSKEQAARGRGCRRRHSEGELRDRLPPSQKSLLPPGPHKHCEEPVLSSLSPPGRAGGNRQLRPSRLPCSGLEAAVFLWMCPSPYTDLSPRPGHTDMPARSPLCLAARKAKPPVTAAHLHLLYTDPGNRSPKKQKMKTTGNVHTGAMK